MKNHTGFVLKNDIYARGIQVSSDGVLKSSKKCAVCHLEIEAREIVYYIFAARGTQSAQSRYIHVECESQCHISPLTDNGKICRICGKSEELDGCFVLPSRKIYYHQSCLDKTPREIIPTENLEEKIQKRARARLQRGRVRYGISILPYKGLDLHQYTYGDYEIELSIYPIDGRIKQVHVFGFGQLFMSNRWVTRQDLENRMKEFTLKDGDRACEDILQVVNDLQQHYDKRGYPIGERLDADFHLRFLLNHGSSIEGTICEAKK